MLPSTYREISQYIGIRPTPSRFGEVINVSWPEIKKIISLEKKMFSLNKKHMKL